MIEADAAEPDGGFGFAAGVRDDHDGLLAMKNRAGPGGVLPAEADVDAAGEMRGGKFLRIACIEDLRASRLQLQDAFERKRLEFAFESFLESGALLAVEDSVIREIRRSFGLIGGDQADELLLGHGLQGVVDAALFADGGDGFFADGFSAERACAVCRIDKAGVREGQQLRVERVEEQSAEIGGGPAESHPKIGAADITDKKGVAGENGEWVGSAAVEIENEKGNGFRRVARSFESLQANAAEFDSAAVAQRSKAVFGLGFGAEIDGGADAVAQFEMTGDEIGMEMREDDMLDLQMMLGGESNVLIDVALGIDNSGDGGLRIADEVGSVREARKIKLFENHAAPLCRTLYQRADAASSGAALTSEA